MKKLRSKLGEKGDYIKTIWGMGIIRGGSMKRSLRIRFTLIFTGLTAAILIGIWCVNNWMLESFYVQDKVQTLERLMNR